MHSDCQACEYRTVCNGGCVYYRIGSTGEPDGKDPLCDVYKEMFGVIVEVLMRTLDHEVQPSEWNASRDRDVERCHPQKSSFLFRILPT
jgi:sulfatase maturation enzyme AslB (radical SAM superfamily)